MELQILSPKKAKENARAKVKEFQLEKKRTEIEAKRNPPAMKPASETTMKKLSLEEKERLSRLLWHEVHEGAYSSLVERCLKEGADLDYAKNEFGRTALMKAAYWGLEEIVKLLVEAGADINAQDEKGETALDMSRTRAKVVEFLKTKGAKEGSELP